MISAQFNLFDESLKEKTYINLNLLNLNLWESRGYQRKVGGSTYFVFNGTEYLIDKYYFNSGDKMSKSNKMTNPYISFNMLMNSFKINVMIYKRGVVQLRLSHLKSKETTKEPLEYSILQQVYRFLKGIFSNIIQNSENIIVSEQEKPKKFGIHNMIDGGQPKMCADREGLRPVPYSFYGACPMQNYYVRPMGLKRPDGKYEPCCYKIKKSGKDSLKQIEYNQKHGYPNSTNPDNIPDPDNLSATFTPGTRAQESRRYPGLLNTSKDELMKCLEDFGYIGKETIFDEYSDFQSGVLKEYNKLTKSTELIVQGATALTINNFKLFTKNPYIVTPINENALNVLMFFNSSGSSYFININKDISQTSLPEIKELANTIIEGYLYPYKDELIFYPIDIVFFNGKDLSNIHYLGKDSRYNNLMYSINQMKNKSLKLQIESDDRFDLNIIGGPNAFLTNPNEYGEISGLLFIPINGEYTKGKVNKNLLLWSDTKSEENINIVLSVNKESGNRWGISLDNKKIPDNLLPQPVEIPVAMVKKYSINDGDFILFKINLNIDGTINRKTPLDVINKVSFKMNDYSDIINVLQSIQTPIPRTIFINN